MKRGRPQQAHPIAEHLLWIPDFRYQTTESKIRYQRLPGIRLQIVQAEEMAILAVVMVMMLCREMAFTLWTFVLYVDGIVVDMQRRLYHQRHISRQQYPRCYEPHPFHDSRRNRKNVLREHLKKQKNQKVSEFVDDLVDSI